MKFRTGKNLGLAWAVPAVFFLCNPMVAFFDVLPDCIGCFLMLMALSRVSDLNEDLRECRRCFRILFWIGIGALAVQFYLYGILPARSAEMNPYERPTLLLLSSFILLILQWIFLIPAWRRFFSGMQLLAQFCGGTGILPEDARRRNYCERLSSFFTADVVIASLLSTLPEAAILTSMEYDAGNQSYPFDWYTYIRMFRSVALFLSLILTVIAVIRLLGFWKKVFADREWLLSVEKLYADRILPNRQLLFQRQMRSAFFLFVLGTVFSCNLRVEERSLLPGFFAALLIAGGILLLAELLPGKKSVLLLCGILAGVSIAAVVCNTVYLRHYVPEASAYYADAYRLYLTVRILDGAEAIAFFALAVSLLRELYGLILRDTYVVYAGTDTREISDRATARMHRGYFYRIWMIFVLFFTAAVGNLAEAVFRLRISWLWWIPFLATVLAICLFSSLLRDLSQQFDEQKQEIQSAMYHPE